MWAPRAKHSSVPDLIKKATESGGAMPAAIELLPRLQVPGPLRRSADCDKESMHHNMVHTLAPKS